MYSIQKLRQGQWAAVPTDPGIYWWYFPESCLTDFRITEHCDVSKFILRRTKNGKYCLYHGCASSLRQRVKWHSSQKLRVSALKSGWLSTFRFTLLALIDLDYSSEEDALNHFMDRLEISWQTFNSKSEAKLAETAELRGKYHYPLNIQENRRVELARFTKHLKSARKKYKQFHLL